MEGYLDLIALYQFGVKNAAASLGTAFTPHQAKLLSRFARKTVVNYDGDSAGVKAARRAIEPLLAEDFEIKVLILPNGKILMILSVPMDWKATTNREATLTHISNSF